MTREKLYFTGFKSDSMVVVQEACRYRGIMSGPDSVGNSSEKRLIRIDVSSDTVCPWCFVGKRNLDKALAVSKDQYNFEVLSLPLSFSRLLSLFVS